MDILYERVAGLDVHKDTVVACVRIMADGKATRVVLILGLLVALVIGVEFIRGRRVTPGEAAPPFRGKTLAGRDLSLADLKDRVVVLNFYSSG